MKKICPENFYHIYLKDKCVYSCLTPEKFEDKWRDLKAMVGLMKTDYEEQDLSYEMVEITPNFCDEHSYWHCIDILLYY